MPYRVFVLDSLHGDFLAVEAALAAASGAKYSGTWNQVVRDASHDSNIKLIAANVTDAELVGDLAPLARANLGTGVFKDEHIDQSDKDMRAFGLLGEGDYADQVWYIRPRVTYSTVDQTPTRITTYGDGSGKTFGDALAGPRGYRDKKASITGPCRVYICPPEHIIGTEDMRLDGDTVTVVGSMNFDQSGTSATVRTEIRYDYPEIEYNGFTFDRAVAYGGLMLNDTTIGWRNDIVAMPYTESVALVAGDILKTITMTTDLDTGTILDFDGSTIWILTDGTAGNSFDNSPTSNDTFTITGGTGAGSQNGAATAEADLYVYDSIPGGMGDQTWCYDPGSAFGNAVHKGSYTTRAPAWGGTMTVQDADGGIELNKRADITALKAASQGRYVPVDSTGNPVVVKLPSGADPTNRVMGPPYGAEISLTVETANFLVYGARDRWRGEIGAFPDTMRYEDFSVKFSQGAAFQPLLDSGGYTTDLTTVEWASGYVGRCSSGIYPAKDVDSTLTIDGLTVTDFVAEDLGGAVAEEADNDGHAIGSQGSAKNLTFKRIYTRRTGGAVTMYQWGAWVDNPANHEWGAVLFEDMDIEDHSPFFPSIGSTSSDVGLHFSGDNNDQASIGNGKATPPTTKQDTSNVVIQGTVRIAGNWTACVRNKWRDYSIDFSGLDLDESDNCFAMAGSDSESAKVVRLPYTESVALVPSDVGKTITMTTDGDTGTIIDYSGTEILIKTDGTAANNFDNSPTANDTFTITTGTGAGSQNGAGAYEPNRGPRSKIRSSTFRGSAPSFFTGIPTADGGSDAVIDSDLNTFVATAAETKFQGATFANHKARTRTGSKYDPNSSLTA